LPDDGDFLQHLGRCADGLGEHAEMIVAGQAGQHPAEAADAAADGVDSPRDKLAGLVGGGERHAGRACAHGDTGVVRAAHSADSAADTAHAGHAGEAHGLFQAAGEHTGRLRVRDIAERGIGRRVERPGGLRSLGRLVAARPSTLAAAPAAPRAAAPVGQHDFKLGSHFKSPV
jgi:hypothetical protein